jgi:uncharacterized protein (TIGR02444 family)
MAEDFWRFSLAFYSRAGVAPALLGLQDRAGVNVNLVLFALWAGACRGVRLAAADLARGEAAIAALDREVVRPLRALRRRLREAADPDMQALRRRIAALELAAERHVQARLAAGLPERAEDGNRLTTAGANLALVLGAGMEEATGLLGALAAFLDPGNAEKRS